MSRGGRRRTSATSAPRPIRRELVAVTVGTTVLAVVLVAVPLAFVRLTSIDDRADSTLRARATELAFALHDHVHSGEPLDSAEVASRLLPETAAVVMIGRQRVEAGSVGNGATRTAVGAPVAEVQVTLTANDEQAQRDKRNAILVVIVLAVASSLVAAPTGLALARRIERPIEALAVAADAAGHGDLRRRASVSGIAEVDRVALAMNATLDRLVEELASEQGLSDKVAHQLRNSLTALRLQVEVAGLAVTDEKVLDGLHRIAAQVDRLDDTIRDLTVVTRRSKGKPAPLREVITDCAEFWRPSFEQAGRHLRVDDGGLDRSSPDVDASAARQSLDVLVENALRHGGGTLTISTGRRNDTIVVIVEDEGPGVPEGMEQRVFEVGVSGGPGRGTGQGLALARAVLHAAGGRLELTRPRPARFEVWLPTSRDTAAHDPGGAT